MVSAQLITTFLTRQYPNPKLISIIKSRMYSIYYYNEIHDFLLMIIVFTTA
jgi:hypothetical protein